ncbi:MAG: hypothetical protein ACRC8M_00030 [Cetobacterium sp.]|uniref:hypothetical protein n=1 Tax=Cetobacterium sp. TaxID=2071632 RepID=UPI003F2FA86E
MNKILINFVVILVIAIIGVLFITFEEFIVKKIGVKKVDSFCNKNYFFKSSFLTGIIFMIIVSNNLFFNMFSETFSSILFMLLMLSLWFTCILMVVSTEIQSPYSDYELEVIKPRTFIRSTKLYCLEQMNINIDLEKLKDLEIEKLREVIFELDTDILINRNTEFNEDEKKQLLKEYGVEKRELYHKLLGEKEREKLKQYSENNLKNWV